MVVVEDGSCRKRLNVVVVQPCAPLINRILLFPSPLHPPHTYRRRANVMPIYIKCEQDPGPEQEDGGPTLCECMVSRLLTMSTIPHEMRANQARSDARQERAEAMIGELNMPNKTNTASTQQERCSTSLKLHKLSPCLYVILMFSCCSFVCYLGHLCALNMSCIATMRTHFCNRLPCLLSSFVLSNEVAPALLTIQAGHQAQLGEEGQE